MKNESVVRALVIGFGSIVESLPRKTQKRTRGLMAEILASGLVSDPDAEALIEAFADRPE